MKFKIHRLKVTDSTNRDAASAAAGEVFVAEEQTAGRGRLDHRWLSAPGENLLMSAVFDVADLPVAEVATFPLVVGLAVREVTGGQIKWPNDVLVGGRKIAGILCERHGDRIVAGIGINVRQRVFDPEIAARTTSLALEGLDLSPDETLDHLLVSLERYYDIWRSDGFASLLPQLTAVDALKGRWVSVRRTDDDGSPAEGLCGGIAEDGSLLVAGERIYAGEAHVESGVLNK